MSVESVVDASDVERFAEEMNLSDNETANLSQSTGVSQIVYGDNPQLVDNGSAVNDTVITESTVTVAPGESKTSSVSVNVSVVPDRVNLRENGRFVTAYVEVPETWQGDRKTNVIDLSSVRLEGVPAITDGNGFVKNRRVVDRDGDGVGEVMVRFPGDAVRDTLTTGEEVSVTVSGRATNGILFRGRTHIDVVNPGSKANNTNNIFGGVLQLLGRIIQIGE